jgi:hypothetical protein
MSKEEDKIKHSRRLQQKENHINRQVAIAKEHHIPVKQPHKLAKQSPISCGNPKCVMCANPRKTFEIPTIQERRLFQKEFIDD